MPGERKVEISLIALEGLLDFIMQPEVQAIIDGAFDPDAYVQEARQVIIKESQDAAK